MPSHGGPAAATSMKARAGGVDPLAGASLLLHRAGMRAQDLHRATRRCGRCPRPTHGPGRAGVAVGGTGVGGLRAINTRTRHAQIHALLAKGVAIKAIARQLDLDRKTVRRYARVEAAEALLGPRRADVRVRGVLGPFKSYLQSRCRDGVTNTTMLAAEIREQGYRGGLRTLRRYLSDLLAEQPKTPEPESVPSARAITGWIMRPEDKVSDDERAQLRQACAQCPDIAATVELARSFNHMVRQRGGAHLETWLNKAVDGPIPQIRSFANALSRDLDAVKAGLTQPWSSGAVEGQVNRIIKMLKRQMLAAPNSTYSETHPDPIMSIDRERSANVRQNPGRIHWWSGESPHLWSCPVTRCELRPAHPCWGARSLLFPYRAFNMPSLGQVLY